MPYRSPAGHRRYDSDQVDTLRVLSQLCRDGGQTIRQLIDQVRSEGVDVPEDVAASLQNGPHETIAELIRLLVQGDGKGAGREYARLAALNAPMDLVNQVIYPGLMEAGEGWYRQEYSVYKERLITVFLRRKLCGLIEEATRSNEHPVESVIVGTLKGDLHEGGVLIFNLAMELRGWRVHNLGVDLPVSEYRKAVDDLQPSALAISFTLSRNVKKRFQELEQVSRVPVFVGGRSIVNYQSLARGHGLIPLPGQISESADDFESQYHSWRIAQDGGSSTEGSA